MLERLGVRSVEIYDEVVWKLGLDLVEMRREKWTLKELMIWEDLEGLNLNDVMLKLEEREEDAIEHQDPALDGFRYDLTLHISPLISKLIDIL